MARISKYQFDQKVTKDDFVIGSDSQTKKTRNYKLEDLAEFFGTQDAVLGNKFSYTYDQQSQFGNLNEGFISFNNRNITNTPFSGVTTIYLNRYNNSGNDVYVFLQKIRDTDSILTIHSNLNNTKLGVYTVQTVNILDNDVIFLNVNARVANGTITGGEPLLIEADFRVLTQTYTHTQITAATTWLVSHNLNKKPSVTVVDDGENVIIADVEYINENELTIHFTAPTSGKAYLN